MTNDTKFAGVMVNDTKASPTFLATQLLDFLMTEASDFIVTSKAGLMTNDIKY